MTASPPLAIRLDPPPDPLALLERVASLDSPAFLDAAAERSDMGRWSYLAWDPVALLECDAEEWPLAANRLRQSWTCEHPGGGLPPFIGGWIGWLSYELGRAFDRQPTARLNKLKVPDLSLALYDIVVAWDHVSGECWLISNGVDATGQIDATRARQRADHATSLIAGTESDTSSSDSRKLPNSSHTNFVPSVTEDEYLTAVRQVIEYIRSGDLFQANFTQRFSTPFSGQPLDLFKSLRRSAPGSHAAYIDRGKCKALSMSPERFLRFDAVSREVETRPIKGTRPRTNDPVLDIANAAELESSAKDRAENVMIVDLLRNDLSRVCNPGSVETPSLCRLESYAAVHHLVSIVRGKLADDSDALDLLAATFPGGSITGAPKLRALEIIAQLEPDTRGVYCGAIGWLGLDGSMELNIAIRTVTLADGQAVLGAGGGVTLLSDPNDEYRESLTKADALLRAIEECT